MFSLKKLPSYPICFAWLTFSLAVAFASLLFIIPGQITRYSLIALCVITILSSYKYLRSPDLYRSFATFIKPWLIWIIGMCALCAYHGMPGFSRHITGFALLGLLFFSLKRIQIKKDSLIIALALISTLLSTLICLAVGYDIFTKGSVQSYILGINKNLLMPPATLVSICCLVALLTKQIPLNKQTYIILVTCIVASFLALVLSETRTALLAYLALIPTLIIYCKNNKKQLLYFFVFLLLLVSAFLLTGRIQEGIADLVKYSTGNSHSSWGIRLDLWKAALDTFSAHPIFGLGGNFKISDMTTELPNYVKQTRHLHSDYLQFLVMGGIVAFFSWISTCILLVKNSLNNPFNFTIILSALAMGLSDKVWNSWLFLIVFICFYTLFYLSNSPSEQTNYKDIATNTPTIN